MSYSKPAKQQTLVNQPPVGDDYEDSIGSEEVENEAPQRAMVAVDPLDHVTPRDFRKPLKLFVTFEVVGSPHELGQNPEMARMMLTPEASKQFKQNMAMFNRHAAVGEDLAGNLKRVVPLDFIPTSCSNTFPYGMGLNIDGFLGRHIHRHGTHAWRIAANTPSTAINRSIFEPVNKVNAHMLQNMTLCTPEDLETDITFQKGRSRILVGSLAYTILRDTIEDGATWSDADLQHVNVDHVLEPGRDMHVEISEKMGRDILNHAKPMLEASAAGFINAETWGATFERADGIRDFASPKNLVGDVVTSNTVTPTKISADLLHKRATATVVGELIFHIF